MSLGSRSQAIPHLLRAAESICPIFTVHEHARKHSLHDANMLKKCTKQHDVILLPNLLEAPAL